MVEEDFFFSVFTVLTMLDDLLHKSSVARFLCVVINN